MSFKRSGFTLIELLVVIAIIAILAVIVILTLNPVELLKQARDSNRVSDLGTMKDALSLFQADEVGGASSTALAPPGTCYVSIPETEFWAADQSGAVQAMNTCTAWFASAGAAISTSVTPTAIDSTGWIPVNFSAMSSGAPFGALPADPISIPGISAAPGAGGLFYSFIAGASSTFKMAAFMESTKYSNSGSGDVESTDGGINDFVFEEGTDMGL